MKLPYKVNWTYEIIAIVLMAIAGIASFYFYANFPATVATHWNIAGEPDAWSGKIFAAFFFPIVIVGLYLLLLFLPLIDPLKKRYHEFSKVYQVVRLSLVVFMVALYFITSLIGLGFNISVNKVMPIGVGLLFITFGNFMPKIKKNWFVGIRTPWTLSNEEVWNKTHRVGGKVFVVGGVLMWLALILPPTYFIWLFAFIITLILVGTVGYSWWIWKKLGKPNENN